MKMTRKSIWPYIKGYKFNSLLIKNFIYVLLLVAVPLLLVVNLNYSRFNSLTNEQVISMNEELLHKSAVVTDNVMISVIDTLNRASRLNSIGEIVQMDSDDSDYNRKVEKVISTVRQRILTNKFINSAYIYSDVNRMMIDGNRAVSMDAIKDRPKWYEIHKQYPMESANILLNNSNSIYVCQPIYVEEQSLIDVETYTEKLIGIFVADVELRAIRDLLESQDMAQQGVFFIMDNNGQTIYCNAQDYFSQNNADNHKYRDEISQLKAGQSQLFTEGGSRVISVTESVHKSWQYALVSEMPEFEEKTGVVRSFLLSSVLVGVVTSIIVAYIITLLTYEPMRKIMDVIKNPQLHWSEKEASKQSNELLYITSNILADRNVNKEISAELEERIQLLRQAQFRALQFQIDPHFLNNTLETIKWAAVEDMGLGNRVSKMLTKLAGLYRLGLENDDVIISLREELDFLKRYVEIVSIRFGETISFGWNIDDTLYDCGIIKMCIQPVVENAIHHGLRPNGYKGNITISVFRQDEDLCVAVQNDAQDIDPDGINSLNEALKTGIGHEENKVGLRNVNERIKLIYGRKYGVSVCCSEQEAYARVVLTFPCRNIYGSEETK